MSRPPKQRLVPRRRAALDRPRRRSAGGGARRRRRALAGPRRSSSTGAAVTGWVWLYLAVSFGGLGFLVGWLLELRRRERAASAEVLRQTEALDRARLEPGAEREAGGARTARRQHLARGAQPARDPAHDRPEPGGGRRQRRRRAPLVRVPARRDRSAGTGDRLDPRSRAAAGASTRTRCAPASCSSGCKLLQPLEVREKGLRLEVRDRVRRGRDRGRRRPPRSGAARPGDQRGAGGARARLRHARGALDRRRDRAVGARTTGPASRRRIASASSSRSTRRAATATGSGLAVVRQIARAHGAAGRGRRQRGRRRSLLDRLPGARRRAARPLRSRDAVGRAR